jgi:lipoprotein-anchoring transpeptidase ErfK/SrfK
MKLIILGFASLLTIAACNNTPEAANNIDAYGANANEIHLVVAAPLASPVEQRLWVCQGDEVYAGSNPSGYPVSIGLGQGTFEDPSNQTARSRNRAGSNLTPVGELRISNKIPGSCAEGMLTRCMQLDGVESAINDRTIRRSIYIHGTPSSNYDQLGRSASHGCIRMNQRDVVSIYNRVRVGTRVFVNSKAVDNGHPCWFTGAEDGGRAR